MKQSALGKQLTAKVQQALTEENPDKFTKSAAKAVAAAGSKYTELMGQVEKTPLVAETRNSMRTILTDAVNSEAGQVLTQNLADAANNAGKMGEGIMNHPEGEAYVKHSVDAINNPLPGQYVDIASKHAEQLKDTAGKIKDDLKNALFSYLETPRSK